MATTAPPLPSLANRVTGFDLARLPSDFGDWRREADACRKTAALFDYSCLVTVAVQGPRAQALLESFCARDLRDMPVGAIRYALTATEDGRLLSDLTLWRTAVDAFLVMTGRPDDVAILGRFAERMKVAGQVVLENRTEQTYVLALQGPEAIARFADTFGFNCPDWFTFVSMPLCDQACLIGRLGYTGEDGVEVLCSRRTAARLWDRLATGARPSGFKSANLLRLGANLPLFTHEFAPGVSATEAGLARIRRDHPDRQTQLTRTRVFARPTTQTAVSTFQPAGTRPAKGEIAVTSAAPWDDEGTVLLMGYVHDGEAPPNGDLRDPSGRFEAVRPIAATGLLT